MVADWLARLETRLAEGGDDELSIAVVALAYAAGERISIPEAERLAGARRALLLLAAGGDPGRGLDLNGRAVTALAADLDRIERRRTLQAGLDELARNARGSPHVKEAVRALANDPDLAWRAFAAALLAEELEAD